MGSVPIELVYEQVVSFAREAGARRVVLFGSRAWHQPAKERH